MSENVKEQTISSSLTIAKLLMTAGSEAYLANAAVKIIMQRAGYNNSTVTINSTSVLVSVDQNEPVYLQDIKSRDINLQKISDVWDVVQNVQNGKIEMNNLPAILDKLETNNRTFSFAWQVFGAAAMSGAILYLLGGKNLELLYAFVLGGIIYYLNTKLTQMIKVPYFALFVSSIVLGFLAVLLHKFGLMHNEVAMIIGGLMPFYPGVELTTGFTDIISGDLTTGITRMAEGIWIALVLSSGCLLAISLKMSGVF